MVGSGSVVEAEGQGKLVGLGCQGRWHGHTLTSICQLPFHLLLTVTPSLGNCPSPTPHGISWVPITGSGPPLFTGRAREAGLANQSSSLRL